jgi:alkanesulfonate monooxygenase SsuD/methylene tetrahydromethanopterin reductase-like flavin-dependent oxidoreductase (luciferase family)
VTDIDRRIPHVFPRAELAWLLAPTYAGALAVDEDIAVERLGRALESPEVLAGIHAAIGEALEEARGPRTDPDAQLDRISRRLQVRRSRVRPAEATPAVSAAMIWMNLAIGMAPESMRDTLASAKGAAMLSAGLRAVATGLLKDLSRG